jgi:biotin carboxyl carrier protein
MAHEDLSPIRHALGLARERGFAEVVLEYDDVKFKAALQPATKLASRPAPSAASDDAPSEPALAEVTATLVGYVQPARQPVQVGDQLEVGKIVASVTALGIATDVESAVSGEVVEVLFEPNQPVMYGQALLRVKP